MDQIAARQLGLSVVELWDAPFYLREQALTAVSAENWAEKEREALRRLKQREQSRSR